jgi:hypothetical protein
MYSLHLVFAFLCLLGLIPTTTDAACVAVDSTTQCTNSTDCCPTTNGTYCRRANGLESPAVKPICRACPPQAGGCLLDTGCCSDAPYGSKGWCRILSTWPTVFSFCEQCQPDGGYCAGGIEMPGATESACCSHVDSRCNTTSGLCYNASGLPPLAPSPPYTLKPVVAATYSPSRVVNVPNGAARHPPGWVLIGAFILLSLCV